MSDDIEMDMVGIGSNPTHQGTSPSVQSVGALEFEQDEGRPIYSDDLSSPEHDSSDDEELPLLPPPHIPYEGNTDIFAIASQQHFADGVDSPNDMLVDTDDLLADAENEKDDVAIINPDSDSEPPLRASDCRSIGSS
jgi:hypothetical protein